MVVNIKSLTYFVLFDFLIFFNIFSFQFLKNSILKNNSPYRFHL